MIEASASILLPVPESYQSYSLCKEMQVLGGGAVTTRIHGHQKVEITHYKALDILKDSHIEKEKSS